LTFAVFFAAFALGLTGVPAAAARNFCFLVAIGVHPFANRFGANVTHATPTTAMAQIRQYALPLVRRQSYRWRLICLGRALAFTITSRARRT